MGRNGDLLRKAKAEKTAYTFTKQQLAEHDDFIRQKYAKDYKEQADDYIRKEWDRREELFSASHDMDNFYLVLQYLLAISSRVLVEQFGWKTAKRKDSRLGRFGDFICDEINSICSDETKDIRNYIKETEKKYGVKFTRIDEEE